ncbi:MAG TPA: tetratricopeptide repeat protein [Phototrophicaceae bacterium]|nr:tetratricopeptide repeat protein [Phototrophicaceae bacterium]
MRLLTRTFIIVIVLFLSFVFFTSSHAQESPVVCTDQPLQQGQTLYAAQDYNGAIVAYTCALQTVPNNAAIYNRRGNAYRQLGDYATALADYNRAIEFEPDNALILNNRGWVHYQLDQLDLALADFNNALENDPQLAEAYNNRGLVYARQAQYAQALADFNQAGELGLETDWAAYNKDAISGVAQVALPSYIAQGKAAYDQKDYETAIANYKLARAIDPNNYQANYGLVDAYYNLPDYASARDAVEFMLKNWPDTYDVQFGAGLVYKQLGQYDKAITAFNKALELASDNQKLGLYVLRDRGNVYYLTGEYQKALDDFNQSLIYHPNEFYAYLWRSLAYTGLGEGEKARTNFASWQSHLNIQRQEGGDIEPGATHSVEMADDRLYEFTFVGKAGQQITITADQTGQPKADPLLVLYDTDGLPISADDDSGDDINALIADFTLPDDGTYTIAVTHAGGGSDGTIEVQLDITTP